MKAVTWVELPAYLPTKDAHVTLLREPPRPALNPITAFENSISFGSLILKEGRRNICNSFPNHASISKKDVCMSFKCLISASVVDLERSLIHSAMF